MADVERRLTTSMADEGGDEEAFGRAAEELRKKRDQEDMERMEKEAQERQRELEHEQEELAKYKERKALREREREEDDRKKAHAEVERLQREEEEKRKRKEAVEKKQAEKKLQQLGQQNQSSSQDKMSLIRQNIEKAKDEAQKSEAQLKEEKVVAVAEIVKPLDVGGLGVEGLMQKAREFQELIRNCEGEKYDLEIRIKKQAYEVKELNTRISEQMRRLAKPAIRIAGRQFGKFKEMSGETTHRRKRDEPSLESAGGVKGRANMFMQQKKDEPKPIERKGGSVAAPGKFGVPGSQKCENCKKTVYPGEKIEAQGLTFHKPCFRCCECHKTLNSNTFGYFEEKFLCKNHYRKALSAQEREAENAQEQNHHEDPVHNDVGEEPDE